MKLERHICEHNSLWPIIQAIPLACCAVSAETGMIFFSNLKFIKLWNLERISDQLEKGNIKYTDCIKQCLTMAQDVTKFIEICSNLPNEAGYSKEDIIDLNDGRSIRQFVSIMVDNEGKKLGCLYMYEDLTHYIESQSLLVQKQMEYRQLYLNSPAVMMVVNPKTGKVLTKNKAACDYYGYTSEQFNKLTLYNIDNAERSQIDHKMQEIIMADGKAFYSDHRLANGEIRNVEVFASPFSSRGNKLINSIVFDVTAKMQSEKKLRESHERLSLILDGAGAGTWDVDFVNNTGWHDSRWKAMLGYGENEVIGDWHRHIHPDDVKKVDEAIQETMNRKSERYSSEYRLLHKNGTYRWVYSTCSIIYDQSSRPLRLLGLTIDITRRKELEAVISESEKRLKDFARAIPELTAIVDEDGRYIEVFGQDNKFLYPPETMKGRTIHELFPSDLADTMLENVRTAIISGKVSHLFRELHIGTETCYFEGRTAPMDSNVNGKKTAVVLVSDITQRISVERMLRFTYELRRRSDFFNDLINGDLPYDDKTLATSKEWGIDLTLPLYCCLIQFQDIDHLNQRKDLHSSEDIMTEIVKLIIDQMNVTVWENRNIIAVIFQDNEGGLGWEKSLKAASQLKHLINHYAPPLAIIIAVSDIHSKTGSLMKSYREAWNALLAARCITDEGSGIFHFRDIGLFQILAGIERKDDRREFVENNVGPLINYDSEKGTDLLITLEKLLKSNNLREAADELYIHRKTLVFRKQRIERLLSVSLDNYQTRLALSAAIMLYKLDKSL